MINIILGAPGGGKSYEAVSFHVLPALEAGRKVITNLPLNVEHLEAVVPGAAKLIDIREKTLAQKPEPKIAFTGFGVRDVSGSNAFVDRPFANLADYQDSWRDENGRGPLYVIDECHFCLPAKGTSKDVEEWYSMHRHYNVDVLLITQSHSKVSKPIIDLVQVCYKVRKATALGKSDGYIRKVHDGVRGGEVSTQQRKYQARYFKLYKSHTQGTALQESGAADVSSFLVKFNRFKWVWVAFSVVFVAWAFWPKNEKAADQAAGGAVVQVSQSGKAARAGSLPSSAPVGGRPAVQGVPEPLRGKGIHLQAHVKFGDRDISVFSVTEAGKRLFTLNAEDLAKLGYRWTSISHCVGSLYFHGSVRTVVCDAPIPAAVEGGTEKRMAAGEVQRVPSPTS